MSAQTATPQGPKLISEKEIGINDVLCGRGTKHCYTAGNKMYHKLVNHFIQDYARATKKTDKTVISIAIVEAVLNATPPGRFLSKHSDTKWKEIAGDKAREKTSQLLREAVMVGRANAKTMYQKKKIDKIIRDVHKARDKIGGGSSQQTQKARLGISTGTINGHMQSSRPSPSLMNASAFTTRTAPSIPARGMAQQPLPSLPTAPNPSVAIQPEKPSTKIRCNKSSPTSIAASLSPPKESTYVPLPPLPNIPASPYARPHYYSCAPYAHPMAVPIYNRDPSYYCCPPSSRVLPFNIVPHPAAPIPFQTGFNTAHTCTTPPNSRVGRLQREISTWKIKPSSATMAELEAVARLQDEEQEWESPALTNPSHMMQMPMNMMQMPPNGHGQASHPWHWQR